MAGILRRSVVICSVGLVTASLAAPSARGQQAPAPPQPAPTTPAAQPAAPPSPVQLANQAERLRIMKELKISAIPPGAVSSSPATYDEAEANPYPDLPDPLTLKNGRKVTTAAMWSKQRRPELLEDFQREIYGRTPKSVPKVNWKVVNTLNETDGDVPIITKQLLGVVDNAALPGDQRHHHRDADDAGEGGGTSPGHHPVRRRQRAAAGRNGRAGEPLRPSRGFGGRAGGRGAAPAGTGAGRGGAATGAPAPPPGPTWQQQLLAKGWGYANVQPRQRAGRLRRRPDGRHHRPRQQGTTAQAR